MTIKQYKPGMPIEVGQWVTPEVTRPLQRVALSEVLGAWWRNKETYASH